MAANALFRPRQQSVIFGVCAGLGQYFDVDPVLIRLLFILLAFAGGFGIVAYVALAVVMPSERSVGRDSRTVLQENVQELREAAAVAGQELAETVRRARAAGRRRQLLGLALVVLGGVLLLGRLGFFWWLRWELLWPLLLMGLGMLLLLRRPGA
ncbi:MAG TPA: PspC domain-containing protein [Limnochordales bacterium]